MSRQTIFAFVLILVLGITGYLWYGYFDAAPAKEGAVENENQTLRFSRIGDFQNIRLDTSIFQDPLFMSLEPPQIIPQPDVTPGRANPFAPF